MMANHDTPPTEANGINGTHTFSPKQEPNAWSSPGPAAYDFRSDVVTTPTPSMLHSIRQTTLLDDVFAEDPTTLSLESHIATLTGHTSALLVLSGTMGNQISIRAHLTQGPPHAVLADERSHVFVWEAGGVCSLSGAWPQMVRPSNGRHLAVGDVEREAVVEEVEGEGVDVHKCPTRLVCLENTLNGTILTLEDVKEISEWARSRGVKMHLDGARLWEAVAAGAGSLKDYCQCFDSVSLCFSKGLGAPIGSIIVGSRDFIRRARHIRKSLGGGLRQSGVVAAPARVAVDETFLGGKLRASHEVARRVEGMWKERGGKVTWPTETNMVWFDLKRARVGEEWVEEGVRQGIKLGAGGRVVCHYQIGEEAVERLGRVMDVVLEGRGKGKGKGKSKGVALAKHKEKQRMRNEAMLKRKAKEKTKSEAKLRRKEKRKRKRVDGEEGGDGMGEREVKRVAREVAAPEME